MKAIRRRWCHWTRLQRDMYEREPHKSTAPNTNMASLNVLLSI